MELIMEECRKEERRRVRESMHWTLPKHMFDIRFLHADGLTSLLRSTSKSNSVRDLCLRRNGRIESIARTVNRQNRIIRKAFAKLFFFTLHTICADSELLGKWIWCKSIIPFLVPLWCFSMLFFVFIASKLTFGNRTSCSLLRELKSHDGFFSLEGWNMFPIWCSILNSHFENHESTGYIIKCVSYEHIIHSTLLFKCRINFFAWNQKVSPSGRYCFNLYARWESSLLASHDVTPSEHNVYLLNTYGNCLKEYFDILKLEIDALK